MRRLFLLAAPSFAIACALAYGCVGSEPSSVSPVDGGTGSDGAATADSGGQADAGADTGVDAHVPTCAGQTFGTPVQVDTSAIAGSLDPAFVWGPRVVNATAYFAALPNPIGANAQQIYQSTFDGGGAAPSLSAMSLVPGVSSAAIEWAPAVSRDGAFMVFARGDTSPNGRDLYVAMSSGPTDFTSPTAIAGLNTATPGDDTDPWLAGGPSPQALYFAREASSSAPMQVFRATVSRTAPNPPTFGTPSQVVFTCPETNCGTPVVVDDESVMLVGSWAGGGGFVPHVREVALTKSGGVVQTGAVTDHTELGSRYPSWTSPDGCEVLLASGPVTQIYSAKRTAK